MWVNNNSTMVPTYPEYSGTTVSPSGQLSDPLDVIDMLPVLVAEVRETSDAIRRIDRNTETLKVVYAPIAIVGMGAITAAILFNASKKRR